MATVLPPTGSLKTPGPGWDVSDKRLINARARVSASVLVVAFAGLLLRLYWLQIVEGDKFRALAQRNRLEKISLPAARGLITDRSGKTLATSRAAHAISVVPRLLPRGKRKKAQREKILNTLGFLLEIPPSEIKKRLEEARGFGPYDPVPVLENADLKLITRVEENKSRLGNAVLVTDNLRRLYPEGALAAHVLGYTGVVNERDLERAKKRGRTLAFDDKIGKSGLERFYDAQIRGVRGKAVFEVDADGTPIRSVGTTPDTPGNTLQLTLDLKLQKAAETALARARNKGSIAVVDPRNGEVLALSSRPGFDPNIFSLPRAQFVAAYNRIAQNPQKPLLNRAIVGAFPPGSTFKPVVAAIALEHGAITPRFGTFCPGYYRFGRRFGCDGVHHYQSLTGALAKSCNVYFYQTGLKMGNPESSGPEALAQGARKFGLGNDTGLDFPQDGAGIIPDPAWRRAINKKRPDLARWQPGNTLNMSIGQGDVLATPLQMALATAAIANGGTLWKPHLMREVRSPNGKLVQKFQPQGQSVGVSRENIEWVRKGMRAVVTGGTGRGSNLGWVQVAGKTGSAEDWNHALPHSWWVCFAPYDKPRVAIACLIENSGHGSENALPVAKAVLEAAFPKPKTESVRP